MLMVLLFEGILLAVVYTTQHRSNLRELDSLADTYSDNLAQVLAVPLWDYDDEQIATIGTGYIRNPVVHELLIADTDGNVLFEARKSLGAAASSAVPTSFTRGRPSGGWFFSCLLTSRHRSLS